MTVPAGPYAWLNAEPGPLMLLEAVKLYGLLEGPGAADNPTILAWADELKLELGGSAYARWVADWYNADAIAWCGLFMATIAQRANPSDFAERRPPNKFLSALSWAAWGAPAAVPMLGDVLVFKRDGGGHVGLYVGEDRDAFHVLGGNTRDSVSVARLARNRLHAARRPAYRAQPANVRKIALAPTGAVSTNEA